MEWLIKNHLKKKKQRLNKTLCEIRVLFCYPKSGAEYSS